MNRSGGLAAVLGGIFVGANVLGVVLLHLLLKMPWGKALAIGCAALPFVSLPFVSVLWRGPLSDRRPSRTRVGLFLAAPVAAGIAVLPWLLAGKPLLGGALAYMLLLAVNIYFFGP